MKNRWFFATCVVYQVIAFTACSDILPPSPDPVTILAEPIEGLTEQQMASHIEGDEEFARIFGESSGLGPIFVSNSCESCHIGDGKGHPSRALTRFGRYEGSQWSTMEGFGGPQLQHRAISNYTPETLPAEATGISNLLAPAVTGLGYLEAVEDAFILAAADPDDLDGDGISGRPNYVAAPDYFVPGVSHIPADGQYIGRFGKKAAAITLRHQTVNAYLEDIGITSDFRLEENFNHLTGEFTGDNVPDPEVPASVVNNVAFYLRTLKAPPRRNEDSPEVVSGELIFGEIGCTSCHLPTMITGPSPVEALDRVEFYPYTDLLLHDMGEELDDGYTEGIAEPAEWRTAPIWGIGLASNSQGGSAYYLHDGRATTLAEAIEFHGGEGSTSRQAFRNLNEADKALLIKFIESL